MALGMISKNTRQEECIHQLMTSSPEDFDNWQWMELSASGQYLLAESGLKLMKFLGDEIDKAVDTLLSTGAFKDSEKSIRWLEVDADVTQQAYVNGKGMDVARVP